MDTRNVQEMLCYGEEFLDLRRAVGQLHIGTSMNDIITPRRLVAPPNRRQPKTTVTSRLMHNLLPSSPSLLHYCFLSSYIRFVANSLLVLYTTLSSLSYTRVCIGPHSPVP